MGCNDFQKFKTRDIPHMQIKDIKIFEKNELKYHWPLSENVGDISYDKINQRAAKVKNPVWISPKYQKWELVNSFAVNGYAGVAYECKTGIKYMLQDLTHSLFIRSKARQSSVNRIPSNHLNLRIGNQAIYEHCLDRLYDVL